MHEARWQLAQLHEKWYGSPPDAELLADAVFVGYGPPGLKGFEVTPHVPSCNWRAARRWARWPKTS